MLFDQRTRSLLVVDARLDSDSLGGCHIFPILLSHCHLGCQFRVPSLGPDVQDVTVHTLGPLDDLLPGHEHLGGVSLGGLAHHGLLKQCSSSS